MTQEELDALIASEGIVQEVEETSVSDNVTDLDHKNDLVKQLGSITTESEEKATQVFDMLDQVLNLVDESFKNPDKKDEYLEQIRNTIFEIMSLMQYQDIHRQKIERVINTMRTISQVMSHTLDSVTPNIAPSAKHISGDENDDLMDEKELEELISKMTK